MNNIINDKKPNFGDYVLIEQKRYRGDNEFYLAKVIGRNFSNCYVNVPVDAKQDGMKEVLHCKSVEVVSCVVCGVMETEIRKYRLCDVKKNELYNID